MDRKEFIQHVTEPFTDSEGRSHRVVNKKVSGNFLWTVWEVEGTKYLAEFEFFKKDEEVGWTFEKRLEDTPPKELKCPKKFLQLTPPLCDTWRLAVEERVEKINDIKRKLKSLFRERKGKTLRVTLEADPGFFITVPYLDVVSAVPLEGRFDQNGKRYSVPCNFVKEIYYLKEVN